MNKSESIANIAKALVEFHRNANPVVFDKEGVTTSFKYKYASLGQVIDAIKKNAPSNGLSWTQLPANDEAGKVGITTVLMHTSGEWITSSIYIELPPETYLDRNGVERQNNLVQEAGKIMTYLRRYSLASAFGLYSDDDTDANEGEAVVGNIGARQTSTRQQKTANKTTSRAKPTQTTNKKSNRPYSPEVLIQNLKKMAAKSEPATAKDKGILVGALSQYCDSDEDLRHAIQEYLFGVESSGDVDLREISAALAWLKPSWSDQTKSFVFDPSAYEELMLVEEALNGNAKK